MKEIKSPLGCSLAKRAAARGGFWLARKVKNHQNWMKLYKVHKNRFEISAKFYELKIKKILHFARIWCIMLRLDMR